MALGDGGVVDGRLADLLGDLLVRLVGLGAQEQQDGSFVDDGRLLSL